MQTEMTDAQRKQLLEKMLAGEMPDAQGRYGPFGGRYAPETLVPALQRLEAGVKQYLHDPEYQAELGAELKGWVGRPTALTHARGLSATLGRRCMAQARGSGPHRRAQDQQRAGPGAARRNAWARSGSLPKPAPASTAWPPPRPARAWACPAWSTWARWTSNVRRRTSIACSSWARKSYRSRAATRPCGRPSMKPSATGSLIPRRRYYLLGSAVGPHPYPYLVRELQAIIGREARAQMLELAGGLPDAAFACVGGGSNAIGLFHPLLGDAQNAVDRRRGRRTRRGPGRQLGHPGDRHARRAAWQLLDPAL